MIRRSHIKIARRQRFSLLKQAQFMRSDSLVHGGQAQSRRASQNMGWQGCQLEGELARLAKIKTAYSVWSNNFPGVISPPERFADTWNAIFKKLFTWSIVHSRKWFQIIKRNLLMWEWIHYGKNLTVEYYLDSWKSKGTLGSDHTGLIHCGMKEGKNRTPCRMQNLYFFKKPSIFYYTVIKYP